MISSLPIALGIDLGTTYSAVAMVDEHGQAEILGSLEGPLLTPSVVELDLDGNAIVGLTACSQMAFKPENVAFEFKRHIGNPLWKQTIGPHQYSAMLLSAYVLAKLKSDAECHLGRPADYVVITVPAYFNHHQRLATKCAAELAGFQVLRLINEPTAAALDYVQGNGDLPGRTLVFDLGGGTLDVTIVQSEQGRHAVIATDGDHDLGGLLWDQIIVDLICDAFLTQHGADIRGDLPIVLEIKRMAERYKKTLSVMMDAAIYATNGVHQINVRLTRAEFEERCRQLVERCAALVDGVLSAAKLQSADICRVLLVGGSSRMPMIKDLLRKKVSCEVTLSPKADETVASGAAFLANQEMMLKNLLPSAREQRHSQIIDVTSHSLGELVAENRADATLKNVIILPRFTPLPAERENVCVLRRGQARPWTYVTEGETKEDCVTLAGFMVELGRKAEYGDELITRFRYDVSGILTVRVTDPKTGVTIEQRLDKPLGMSDDDFADLKRSFRSRQIK